MTDTKITIKSETEVHCGWEFEITVGPNSQDRSDQQRTITLTLGWLDYEYWSRGIVSPEQIAREIIAHLIATDNLPNGPSHLEAARLRRTIQTLDNALTPNSARQD